MQLTDMFPAKFLRGQDMTKPMLIEMHAVETTELRPGQGKPAETAYVMYFDDVSRGASAHVRGLDYTPRKGHAMVLRRTLARQIMQLTGSTDTEEWRGKRVVLYPEAVEVAGRRVITIRARAPKPVTSEADTSNSSEPAPEAA
jgi:hypothetical protein